MDKAAIVTPLRPTLVPLLMAGLLVGVTACTAKAVTPDERASSPSAVASTGGDSVDGMSLSSLPLASAFRQVPQVVAGSAQLPAVYASMPFGATSTPAATTVAWGKVDRDAQIDIKTRYQPKAVFVFRHDAVDSAGVPTSQDPLVSQCDVAEQGDSSVACSLSMIASGWSMKLDGPAFRQPGYYILQLEWSVRADPDGAELEEASASYALEISS